MPIAGEENRRRNGAARGDRLHLYVATHQEDAKTPRALMQAGKFRRHPVSCSLPDGEGLKSDRMVIESSAMHRCADQPDRALPSARMQAQNGFATGFATV
jgi:hypothetical protein